MRGSKKLLLLCATLLPFAGAASIRAVPSAEPKNNYDSIVDRNPFGLKPPAPPPTNSVAPVEAKPKSEIFLTGIISVGYPRLPKRAYFKTMEQGKKDPKFYELTEEQSVDGITVLHIDDRNRTVKIKMDNEETLLSFKTHGINAPTNAPLPTAAGRPGAPGVPGQTHNVMVPQPLPLPGGDPNAHNAAGQPNFGAAADANRPTINGAVAGNGSRQIPSRSVRVRNPGANLPTPGGGVQPISNVPQEQGEDPAIQYLRLKAEEARNQQLGIPTPPIPPP